MLQPRQAKNQAKDFADLRNILGAFVTGVTVVTTVDNQGRPRGLTANSFTSVSLNPALILICIGENAASYAAFTACKRFAVNILSERQKPVSALFASKSPDKFKRVGWTKSPGGSPLLDHSLAWLDCRLHALMPVGDHAILVGEVAGYSAGAGGRPLGYFRGGYVRFGLEQDAMDAYRRAQPVLGCIVDDGDRLLLCSDASGQWSVPLSNMAGGAQSGKGALRAVLENIGAEVDFSFIYSLFGVHDGEPTHIIYRGLLKNSQRLRRGAQSNARLFRADEIPWEKIALAPFRQMLRRYVAERHSERFGIYAESDAGGQVAVLESQPQPWASYTNTNMSNGRSAAGKK
ncbi:MAG: flavin reductase [Gammaproteobacteria bacterium]|nr:flavin reductase [Gammaproteobacteria bacterium]